MQRVPEPADELRFGRFRVDARQRALWVDGEPARVGARAFDILLALAERCEREVSKNELLAIVWPNLVVEENNLQVHISALRKLLGSEVIATIPGRGYRFAAVPDGAVQPAPPQRRATAVSQAPGNLPTEPQPLFGRDAELAEACRLIESHRLVTVTGAGGIGKTRIAQAAAHALHGRWPDGTWLVELAPLADAALLPGSVAHALALQLRSAAPPLDELVAALQSQRLLLLLDNCEHLIEATGMLAQALLARTPGVRLLVTSQEPLKVPGEQLYRLGTLALPPAGETPAAEAALGYGAVRLFVERTRALDSRFVFDAHNAAPVIDICRRLDGLALAIELAAARVPALGVQGVCDRLGERLRMLTAGSRIALRRHQTLRAALDWSFGLLDAQEQAVFRRLGVFSGGCSIEAAQQVAGDEQLDEWSVLDQVARLVDKSLVVAEGDDRPRYRLLESARAYALEKLAAAGETDALARRHGAFFAAQFERWADALFADTLSDDAFIALRALELDNLRAAIAWNLGDAGDAAGALELLAHSAPLCFLLPLGDEGACWWRALTRRLDGQPLSARQVALRGFAQAQWSVQGLRQPEQGADAPRLTPAVLGALDDVPRQAYALCVLAVQATWHGELDAAGALLDEVDRFEPTRLPAVVLGLRLDAGARLDFAAGRMTRHGAAIRHALTRLQGIGQQDGRTAFMLRTDLALDSLSQGRFEAAAATLRALAELGRAQRRDAFRMCFLLGPLAQALTELGQLDEAQAVALEALPLLQRTGLKLDYAPVLALLAARRGHADRAARLLGAGDAQLARTGGRRGLFERQAGQQVRALLQASHAPAQIEAWLAEGAALGADAFSRLVAGPD